MIEIPFIEINQPIGTFYIGKLNAKSLGEIISVTPRSASPSAIQRDESRKRINEIANYCTDPDATFPTPIIVSVDEGVVVEQKDNTFIIDQSEHSIIGEVIDGQHRLKGILNSSRATDFELPIILMFDLSEEEKAYVFSIINSKQTKVSMSLIYDLFALSRHRSPQKTAHEIARALNKNLDSPFYNRLKMLGKKTENQDFATLSQGSFVNHLLPLLSKKPDHDFRLSKRNEELMDDPELPLRQYFQENNDDVILKILLNLFSALRDVFPNLWAEPNSNVLWKTTGYAAIMKKFNLLYNIGDRRNNLTKGHFIECFEHFQDFLKEKNLELTSKYFPSNAQQQNRLAELLEDSLVSAGLTDGQMGLFE